MLSGSTYPVRPATRERVLEAARELDYYPSAVGRALVRGQTGVIGVIVHDITDPFFNVITRAIEDLAGEHGYLVVVCNADRHPEKLLRNLVQLRDYRVDGVILVGAELLDAEYRVERERCLAQMRRSGVPVVTIGRYSPPGPGVYYDNAWGISTLVQHLVDLGHRRIAHVAGRPSSRATAERVDAFRSSLRAHALEDDPALIVYGDFSRASGERAVESLLALPTPPTAIVAVTDEVAAGCVLALRRRGLVVPDDMSVTGFNDVATAEYTQPPLTTIRVPLRSIGMRAMQMVLRAREGAELQTEEVPLELVVRDSTAPPRRRAISTAALPRPPLSAAPEAGGSPP